MVGFTFYGPYRRQGGHLPARTTLIPPIRAEPHESSARIPLRSYYGWIKNSDSIQYRRRNNVDQIVRRARNTVAASRKKG